MLDFQTDLLGAQLDQSWNLLSSLEPGTPEVNALFMELKQVNHHGMHVIFWCICTACKPNEYIQVHTLATNTSTGCRSLWFRMNSLDPKRPVQVIGLRAMRGSDYDHIVGVIYSSSWSIRSLTGQSAFFWMDTLGLVVARA